MPNWIHREHPEADDVIGTLPDPSTKFGELLRDLACAAMSVTHHDASPDEPGYRHEVTIMEASFRRILNRYRGVRPGVNKSNA